MSLRLSSSIRYLRPKPVHIRYSSTTHPIKPDKGDEETAVHKSVAVTKAYIDKLHSELKPRLDLYLDKVHHATQQVKKLTSEVHDSQEAIRRASKALNQLTGYDHIDLVKQKVNNQALLFEQTRDLVQEAKKNYEEAIELRSNTQRGINELLQRKHLWTSDDVTQFTELYRLEHAHSQAEQIAKDKYQTCEKQMDREYMELARSIMERYHEEQLWSDKIRSVSTYGTWALMVVNLLVFIAVQTVFEPRKRKRLTDRFEELLISKMGEEEEKFNEAYKTLEEKDQLLMQQQLIIMEDLKTISYYLETDNIPSSPFSELLDEVIDFRGIEHADESIVDITSDSMDNNTVDKAYESILDHTITTIDTTTDNTPLDNALDHPPVDNVLNHPPVDKVIDNTPVDKELDTAMTHHTPEYHLQPSVLIEQSDATLDNHYTLTPTQLGLYSIESAIVGGLMTALAVYFYK
ncbi:Mdm33 family-domain-containing protein [Pilobolus umbonatus]|nr:Mdm33 family-domain-containing protein [Pilobolus umbonatus]